MIEEIWQDVRFGLRLLHRSRGFAVAAVVTLALGIGANTAMFSVVNAVLLKPLPYEEPDRLVRIYEGNPHLGSGIHPASPATFLDWQEHNPVFEEIAAYHPQGVSLTGHTRPERAMAALITPSLIPLLGVEPALGRSFSAGESTPGNSAFVLLSRGLWQRRFAGRPDVLGKSLIVDGRSHTILGVMPGSFHFPRGSIDCWLPLPMDPSNPGSRGSHFLRVVGRLGSGLSVTRAEAGMDALAARLALETPALEGWDTVVEPLSEVVIGDAAAALWMLWGAVGFVMLIVCGNVANLMLTRSVVRQREIAIRTSLGAGRSRLIRQLLTESLLLAAVGGGLGVLVAMWTVPSLVALSDGAIPRAEGIGIDRQILAFTAGLSVVTGLLFGLVPALQVMRRDPETSLRDGGRTQAGTGSSRLRDLFVVTEVALALVLLAGAGLMLRTLSSLHQVHPGFRAEGLLTFALQLPEARYTGSQQISSLYGTLLERVAALPGVESAGSVQVLPTMGTYYSGFGIVGKPARSPDEVTSALYRAVSPDYFRTMKIPLLRGRGFTRHDTEESSPVVLVNETFVRRYLVETDALGQKLDMGAPFEIVGVVGDVRHLGLDTAPSPALYVSSSQDTSHRSLAIALRTSQEPTSLMPAVRALVASLDRDLPVFAVMTGDEVIGSSMAERRFAMTLLAIFAGVAVVLAIVGIYGVMSYSTSLRSHEIGVRMALGAQEGDVLRLVVGQGVRLAVFGLGVGLAGALALTRLLEGLLFGVTANDPVSYAGAVVLLFVAAVVASFVPARRAAHISPIRALHCE